MNQQENKIDKPSELIVLTHIQSPYQAELFDAVAAKGRFSLRVLYLHRHADDRLWSPSKYQHEAIFLDDKTTQIAEVLESIQNARLVIFNYYNAPLAQQLIHARTKTGKPWVFWGERPRVHVMKFFSQIYRAWKLRKLHASKMPIWGIGQMAVDAYRNEFGSNRGYVNFPYFSDLTRFTKATREHGSGTENERVILFSGSLIPRKGVDLVAKAFARLVEEGYKARLCLMGSGELEQELRLSLATCASQVEFLGFRDWQDLPAEYAQADILCVPSRYDGWGLVVPEGLAAGLPTISTVQTGAAVEFIRTGHNGWLIPQNDEDALYQAMKQALSIDKSTLETMAENARVTVRMHSLEQGANRFIEATKSAF